MFAAQRAAAFSCALLVNSVLVRYYLRLPSRFFFLFQTGSAYFFRYGKTGLQRQTSAYRRHSRA